MESKKRTTLGPPGEGEMATSFASHTEIEQWLKLACEHAELAYEKVMPPCGRDVRRDSRSEPRSDECGLPDVAEDLIDNSVQRRTTPGGGH